MKLETKIYRCEFDTYKVVLTVDGIAIKTMPNLRDLPTALVFAKRLIIQNRPNPSTMKKPGEVLRIAH
jgi:hypothetical protein